MHSVDKTKWERGPWDDEPDLIEWDTPQGFHAIMVRVESMGHWCGYIGVPPEHKWHRKSYNTRVKPTELQLARPLNVDKTDVLGLMFGLLHDEDPSQGIGMSLVTRIHGGITFSNYHRIEQARKGWWYFGFDCAHSGDFMPGMTQHEWLRKFKISDETYRNEQYVRNETEALSRQISLLQHPIVESTASRNQREGKYLIQRKRKKHHATQKI